VHEPSSPAYAAQAVPDPALLIPTTLETPASQGALPSSNATRPAPAGAGAESELVDRLKAGDRAAFEQLVRSYGPQMLLVARRFFKREADAEDALQDAFLNVVRSIGSFAGRCRLATWLHRVTVTASLMRLRTRRRRPETLIEELPGGAGGPAARCDTGLPALETLSQQEMRERVRESLQRLPERDQSVLLLHDVQGLDLRETAHLLGVGTSTLKTRLRTARQKLHGFLVASYGATP